MPAANLFAQYLQPPKSVLDYTDDMNRADMSNLLLQGQRGKNALLDVTRQQTIQSSQQEQAKLNALQQLALDPSMQDPVMRENAMLNHPLLSAEGQAMRTSRLNAGEIQARTDKEKSIATQNDWETRAKQADKSVRDIMAFDLPEQALADIQAKRDSGQLDPKIADQIAQTIPNDPAQFHVWQIKMGRSIMDAKGQEEARQADAKRVAPTPTETKLGNRVAYIDTNPNSQTYGKEVAQAAIGQSPDNAATVATTQRGQNISAATAQRGQDIGATTAREGHRITAAAAGLNPDGSPAEGGGGLLNEQSIINAATRYNTDGTLPPNIGRGTQGVRQTAAILNEAARQAAERGDTPEAQRIAQIANKASGAALSKLQTQQTMVGAFEKNFTKNADMVEGLAAKVDNSGVPILNKWINVGKRSVSGDPDISALDANIKATVNEYAKIVGGGTGGSATAQGEIAKIEGLLSSAQSPAQIKSVLSVMRKETANRMTAFEDEKSQLKSSMIVSKPKPAAAASVGSGTDLGGGFKVK